jgi:3-oxoacyl-[acyl-carrier-protein] synthase-3
LASKNISAGIIGTGSFVPEKILTNFDLEKMVDTTDDWIVRRTGINERHILDEKTPAYQMGVEAALKAMDNAGISAEELDLIIVSTEAPDYLTPSMACSIQAEIGAVNAAAFDVNAACSGFLYGLAIAQRFIIAGCHKYVLVVGCEGLSRILDWEDRNTCVLLGDGAGAAVVGPLEQGTGIKSSVLGSDGSQGRCLTIPCYYLNEEDLEKRPRMKKQVLWMDGSTVLKFAVRAMAQATTDAVEKAGMTLDDIDLIVPHQANIRIIEGAAKRLGIEMDRIYVNLHKYGNISSACIPLALDEASKNGVIKKGDNIVLVAFGGGLTWASGVLEWTIGN